MRDTRARGIIKIHGPSFVPSKVPSVLPAIAEAAGAPRRISTRVALLHANDAGKKVAALFNKWEGTGLFEGEGGPNGVNQNYLRTAVNLKPRSTTCARASKRVHCVVRFSSMGGGTCDWVGHAYRSSTLACFVQRDYDPLCKRVMLDPGGDIPPTYGCTASVSDFRGSCKLNTWVRHRDKSRRRIVVEVWPWIDGCDPPSTSLPAAGLYKIPGIVKVTRTTLAPVPPPTPLGF